MFCCVSVKNFIDGFLEGTKERRMEGIEKGRVGVRKKKEKTVIIEVVLKILAVERIICAACVHENRSELKTEGRTLGSSKVGVMWHELG